MHTISDNDPVGSHTLQVIAKAGKFNRWMYEQFNSFLKGEVLEIGSGIGNISEFVMEEGYNITLSDYNREYIDWLKQKYSGNKNVRRILAIDLLDNDFENAYKDLKENFDSIFLLNVIEHLKDDSLATKNCRFLLKPQGHLIILAPAHQWLYCKFDRELGHYRRYNHKRMTVLLKKHGFTVLNKQYFNFSGIAGWFLLGKIFNRKMLKQGEMSAFNSIVPIARFFDNITFKKIGLSIIVTGQKK